MPRSDPDDAWLRHEHAFEQFEVELAPDSSGKKLRWDSKSSNYPRNWSPMRKAYAVLVISWLELYMTGVSSSGTATAEEALDQFGISRTLAYFCFVSIYLIGQTLGGIFCSPISEVFGRRTIYIIGSGLFGIASLITGAGGIRSSIPVYFGRFLQGVASAIPATVAFGTFADLYDAYSRVWVVYLYTFAGMFGLAAGPIFSTYVSMTIGWRWVYYISTIVSLGSVIACAFLKESNAQQLLEARVSEVRRDTENPHFVPEHASGKLTLKQFATSSLFRPLQLLVTEPVVFFCAILCAIAFGLIYGLTESLSIVYTAQPFDFSEMSASLAFIAIIIGEGINVFARLYDHHVLARYRSLGRRVLPETKITSFAVAAPSLAIGLWIFAWTIPPRVTNVPWPVSMIGLVCIGFSLNDFSYVLFGYATDSYGQYAASAVSAISTTRTLTAAIFPLFTYQMYTGLGSNVATSILASVATVFAFTPILFLRYGGQLRRKSKVATDDEDSLQEENAHLVAKEDDEKRRWSSRSLPWILHDSLESPSDRTLSSNDTI